MNELQKVLDDIKADKVENLIPPNIKTGIHSLGVTGTFIGKAINTLFTVSQDDAGNIWCLCNIEGYEGTPYRLDEDGNFIVTLEEGDESVYRINDNMLEVVFKDAS